MGLDTFFNRVGAAAKRATMATPLGLFFDAGGVSHDQASADSIGQRLQQGFSQAFSLTGAGIVNNALKGASSGDGEGNKGYSLFDAVNDTYSYGVARPISTFQQATGVNPTSGALLAYTAARNLGHHDATDLSTWRHSWNNSSVVTPGQASVASWLEAVSGKPLDPRSAEAQDYFHNTWQGQVTSGGMDMLMNLTLDPTYAAGKGIKAARIARTTFKDSGEAARVLNYASGALTKDEVGGRAVRLGDKLNNFLTSTRGMSQREIAMMPEMKTTSDAGALAYFISRADQLPSDAEALAAKRDIYAVAMGNLEAADRLSVKQADLVAEIRRATSPIETTDGAARFTFDDHGQAMLDFFNTSVKHAEVDTHRALLEGELARLDRLGATFASTSRVASTSVEREASRRAVSSMRESMVYGGMMSRPMRVVTGMVGKGAPGYVNTVDVNDGITALERTLAQSRLPVEVRQKYGQDFMNATSREARGIVVQNAEQAIFKSAADHAGLAPKELRGLVKAAVGRRAVYQRALRSRLYSASPDASYIAHIDEEGVVHAFDRPFLQSQIEDMAPLTDPHRLDQVIADSKRTGIWSDVVDGTRKAGEITDSLVMSATRLWKDSALFRLAYPARVQVDTQGRLMASLGAMAYTMSSAHGLKNMTKNLQRIPLEDLTSEAVDAPRLLQGERVNRFIAPGSVRRGKTTARASDLSREEFYKGVNIAPVRSGLEMQRAKGLLQSDTSMALLWGDDARSALSGMRATGQWGIVNGEDPAWASKFLRGWNAQILNSPVAKHALTEGDDVALKEFVRSNPEARKEWGNFREEYDGNLDEWLSIVRAHVDHMTGGSPQVRAIASQRQLTQSDLEKYFNDVTTRPTVHGEAYVPMAHNPVAQWWNGVRKHFYRFASDAPEEIMGKHPFYNARFRHHMTEMLGRVEGDSVTPVIADRLRRSADLAARKDMRETLFDLSSQTNLAHTFRFLSPFFAAWEDTMQKWGKLFYEDPSRAVRARQAWQAPNDAGVIYTDDRGSQYVVLPKFMAPIIPKGAENWKVRKDSFNIVFQGDPWWLPGFGPAVQIPTNQVVRKFFPKEADSPLMKYILPFGVSDESVLNQLAPGWGKRAVAAFSQKSGDYKQTYAMLYAQELVRYNNGDRKTRPTVEEISNATRNWHILRALSAFASPVSAEPTPVLQAYIDKSHEYRSQDAVIKQAHQAWVDAGKQGDEPPAGWQEKFYNDFPDYFEMTLSLSANNTGIVASDRAFDASKRYRKAIAANPALGWFFVGPENVGAFSQGVNAFQSTQSIGYGRTETWRGKGSPLDAVKGVEAEKGWVEYGKAQTALRLELEARGLHSFTQRGAEDLLGMKQKFVAELSAENPDWADTFGGGSPDKAQSFLRSATSFMSSDKQLAARPDIKALQQYLDGRRFMQQALQSRSSQSLDSQANADLKDSWDAFTSELVQSNIGFEQMFTRGGLENDNLKGDL